MQKEIETSKLYELVLKYKTDTETNRDEINKYYTSLFAALLSFTPFINKIASSMDITNKAYNLRYVMIALSLLGLILSISWKLTLQRTHNYIKGTEELLMLIEKNFEISFITYMSSYLYKTHSPARETKQEMMVPYAFGIIFSVIFIYSVMWFLF